MSFWSKIKTLKKYFWSSSETEYLLLRPAGCEIPKVPEDCKAEFRKIDISETSDSARFEDASHYAPVYSDMLKHGDDVIFA